MSHRANYATVSIQELLAPSTGALELPWAEFAGDRSSSHSFEVPVDEPETPYLQIQAFDVGEYDHEILLNGEALTGFDIPPSDGWQAWMDTIAPGQLQGGENTLRVERNTDGDDAFAVGTVVVHWREPTE